MSADAGVREGEIIAGKYRIDCVLGAGAISSRPTSSSSGAPMAFTKRPTGPSTPPKPFGASSVSPQKPGCDPPFTFEYKGQNISRPECYR
jgi:hypothetical protein